MITETESKTESRKLYTHLLLSVSLRKSQRLVKDLVVHSLNIRVVVWRQATYHLMQQGTCAIDY